MTAPNRVGNVASNILTVLIYLYMIPAFMFFVPYYNWQYAKNHGFVSWLFLGEIVPTAQAVIWPYYVGKHFTRPSSPPIESWTAEEKANSKHLMAAFNSDLEAIKLSNAGGPGLIPQDQLRKIVTLEKTALMEASIVEDPVLDKVHPQLKQHFRDELVPAIELKVKNWEMPQNDLSIHKQIDDLENKWADWFNANKDDFYIPK
jgi:hypothetical protein